MKIPVRLYTLVRSHLNINSSPTNGTVSISKELSALQISEPIMQLEESSIKSEGHALIKAEETESLKKEEVNEKILSSKVEQENIGKKDGHDRPESAKTATEINLREFLIDIEDFDEALHVLNMKGEKYGVQFKKGNIQYHDDLISKKNPKNPDISNNIDNSDPPPNTQNPPKVPKYKSIICVHFKRNSTKKNQDIPSSLEKKKAKKDKGCSCIYRFKFDKKGNFDGLISFEENHSGHEFKIKKEELTTEMKKDIECFEKTSKVADIKSFLDNKYKVDLSYRKVHSEFRKIFPLLGPQDAKYLIKWCEEHDYEVIDEIDDKLKYYTKLLIVSKLMKSHYESYGDILIIDSTYRVNKYKLPYVILSGFTHKGRNCIFGIGVVNNETQDTFRWLLKEFFDYHKTTPKIIVSDHDLALETVIDTDYQNVLHILCQWHIKQSFIKNFTYLSTMNLGAIKEQILDLIWIENSEIFNENYEALISKLKGKNLYKSINYLESMHTIKHKWAQSYLPWRFTGGIHTTSRAESINSLIKKFVNSNCEVSDLIRFLISFEKKFICETSNIKDLNKSSRAKETEVLKESTRDNYRKHPIILELEGILYETPLELHLEQFAFSANYTLRLIENNFSSNNSVYQAQSIKAKNEQTYRKVTMENDKYFCDCESYIRYGLICRHVFALASINQDKNLGRMNIHKRWLAPSPIFKNLDYFSFETPKVLDYLANQDTCLEGKEEELRKEGEEEKDKLAINQGGVHEEEKETLASTKVKYSRVRKPNRNEEEKTLGPTFKMNKKSRGAPKKEQRPKGPVERKNNKS